MNVSFLRDHVDLRSRYAVLLHLACLDLVLVQVELRQLFLECLKGQSGIHQRAENHITADTCGAIEIGDLQDDLPGKEP